MSVVNSTSQGATIRADMGPLEISTVLGTLFWHDFAKVLPLCNHPHSMALLSRSSKQAQARDWNTSELQELRAWVSSYMDNHWVEDPVDLVPTNAEGWSDASDNRGAYGVFAYGRVVLQYKTFTEIPAHLPQRNACGRRSYPIGERSRSQTSLEM